MYTATGAITTADIRFGADIASDPALAEFMCLAERASDVFTGDKPGVKCPRRGYSSAQKDAGAGLYYTLEPLRVLTWAREHPVQSISVGVGIIAALIGVGYYLGSGR